jgi:hypothetical protein
MDQNEKDHFCFLLPFIEIVCKWCNKISQFYEYSQNYLPTAGEGNGKSGEFWIECPKCQKSMSFSIKTTKKKEN